MLTTASGATLATPPQSVTQTLPKTPEIFVHDHDGNLTQDGRWDYTWDADGARQRGDGAPKARPKGRIGRVPHGRPRRQNRLIAMETRTVVATLYPALKTRLEFAYDAQSRRISKTVKTPHPTTGLWQIIEELRFVYDGWNLLAELQPVPGTTNYNVLRTYTWGLDLSGSMQGAGGVGGLLWTTVTAGLPAASTHVAGYDGNGNVTAWIDMASGYLTGQRDYGPSGEVVQQTGVAKDLPFGFSSKYTDKETGQLYYGFRYYNPSTGRWLSRDPIEENGGLNLYGMGGNNPINSVDMLGLYELVFWDTAPWGHLMDTLQLQANGYYPDWTAFSTSERGAVRAAQSRAVLVSWGLVIEIGDILNRIEKIYCPGAGRNELRAQLEYMKETLSLAAAAMRSSNKLNVAKIGFLGFGNKGDAVVTQWLSNLYLSPTFWKANPREQAAKFLHEATHIIERTWDHVYTNPGSGYHREGGMYEYIATHSGSLPMQIMIESKNIFVINVNIGLANRSNWVKRWDGKPLGSQP